MANDKRDIIIPPQGGWVRDFVLRVKLILRLVGDPAEAEDLALETFYRLHIHHHDFGTDFNTGGWLHRVAINLGLHSLRSYKRREHYELAAGQRAIKEAPENRPAEIMADVYKSLYSSQQVATSTFLSALIRSQRAALSKAAHPVVWASFVQMGLP